MQQIKLYKAAIWTIKILTNCIYYIQKHIGVQSYNSFNLNLVTLNTNLLTGGGKADCCPL